MSRKLSGVRRVVAVLTATLVLASCSDINTETAPVELIASVDQSVLVLDLADPECGEEGLGALVLRSLVKSPNPSDLRFLDVRLRTMRISYGRLDGGTVTPEPFVQNISGVISAGGSSNFNSFLVFEPGAFRRAPFVSLYPENGGRDPQTGQPFVTLSVTIEVFGETLSGERVSTRTSFPLTICIGCGCAEVD